MTFVTHNLAETLGRRLAAIDIEDIIEDAFDVATGDGREYLRMELQGEGAPASVVKAVQPLWETEYMHAAVGVPAGHEAEQRALDFEYGSADTQPDNSRRVEPHGTFRAVAADIADVAAGEIAQRLSKALGDR